MSQFVSETIERCRSHLKCGWHHRRTVIISPPEAAMLWHDVRYAFRTLSDVGRRAAPTLIDPDGDGPLDPVIGRERAGVSAVISELSKHSGRFAGMH